MTTANWISLAACIVIGAGPFGMMALVLWAAFRRDPKQEGCDQ